MTLSDKVERREVEVSFRFDWKGDQASAGMKMRRDLNASVMSR